MAEQYIVTVDVPIYVSVRADKDVAADLAETYWEEQGIAKKFEDALEGIAKKFEDALEGIAKKFEDALEDTSWYVGDPYEDWDVSENET